MERLDNVEIVDEENGAGKDPRSRTIPIYGPEYAWWTAAVRRELDNKGWDQKDLAEALGAGESAVSKCINRKVPTYELLLAISDVLKVVYPVILPESEGEAKHLATQRRLYKRDVEAEEIKAGAVADVDGDQPSSVVSEHAVRKEGKKGRARRRRTE